MLNVKLRIMLRAIRLRLERGEELDAILTSYPRLSESEKETLRRAASGGDNHA